MIGVLLATWPVPTNHEGVVVDPHEKSAGWIQIKHIGDAEFLPSDGPDPARRRVGSRVNWERPSPLRRSAEIPRRGAVSGASYAASGSHWRHATGIVGLATWMKICGCGTRGG